MIRKKRKSIHKITARAYACAAAFFASIFAVTLPISGQFTPQKKQSAPNTAAAETASQSQRISPAETLCLPNTYEQYLTLENPSSVAVSENYTAIADGLTIYVYNRITNRYTQYDHATESDLNITQIHFDEQENLYFSTQTAKLFKLFIPTLTAEKTGINSCTTFELVNGTIYYTVVGNKVISIFSKPLTQLNDNNELLQIAFRDTNYVPPLAYNGENLYYVADGKTLFYIDKPAHEDKTANVEWKPSPPLSNGTATVISVAFSQDYLYYTDTDKNLYSYQYTASDLTVKPQLLSNNCTSVSVSPSGEIYTVGNQKIRRIDPETREFTSFEISASSDSDGRLYSAVDAVLSGDTLFTLDQGAPAQNIGARVLCTPAYKFGANETSENGKTATFKIEETNAKYLAATGETILIATASETSSSAAAQPGVLALYDTAGTRIKTFESRDGEPFTGVANIYDTYYAASKNHLYKLEKNPDTKAYEITSHKTQRANKLLAADVYGSIYLAQAHNVYAFTESELTVAFAEESPINQPTEEAIAVLPEATGGAEQSTKLLVDFHRNVYALHGGALVRCAKTAEETTIYPLKNKKFVYAQTEETPVTCAAFGVETEATYILYNGNFIAATYDLPLPTVNTIASETAAEKLFAEEAADFTVAECAAKTLLVRFDVAGLKGAETFPYVSYARIAEKTPAISMGETERYYILAVYDKENNDYYTALAEKISCNIISADEFLTDPPEEYAGGKIGYTTNSLPLYKYPYLTDLITVCPLPRGAEVRVLKTVERLDWKYYQVQYTGKTGETKTGFLPAAYVADTNGKVPEAEQTALGGENNNRDLVWRLVYIILGTLVICILTDYLILRRSDK